MALPLRFLIDECLSPELAEVALDAGYDGAHVGHRGLLRTPDPQIARYCLVNDLIVVTNNARDFRAIYEAFPLHPGLVVVLPVVRIAQQRRLFELVFKRLERERDLVNKLAEVDADGRVTVADWPPLRPNDENV